MKQPFRGPAAAASRSGWRAGAGAAGSSSSAAAGRAAATTARAPRSRTRWPSWSGCDLGRGPDEGAEPAGPAREARRPDPALARLLPDGARDDAEAAAEFRRLTEPACATASGPAHGWPSRRWRRDEPVLLEQDEAQALLKSLTDLRLVLGRAARAAHRRGRHPLHERQLQVGSSPRAGSHCRVRAAGGGAVRALLQRCVGTEVTRQARWRHGRRSRTPRAGARRLAAAWRTLRSGSSTPASAA